MLSITLLEQDEYQWLGYNPAEKLFPAAEGKFPLYHQWRTYNAEEPIIVNTYNTGTGKAKAALLRLLKRVEKKGRQRLSPTRDNVLLIAPTNELLAQHARDAEDFCKQCDLPYRVVPLTRETLDEGALIGEEEFKRARKLHYILNNSSQLDKDLTKRATIYVVNPDIFYYAIYFCYNSVDRQSLFDDFMRLFNYVIIDELHYYSPKQLAAFLFFIKFSHDRGYIESASKQRQFCILTATPRPQVKRYLEHLDLPVNWIEPGQSIPPEDVPFLQPIRALTRVQLRVYNTEELQQGEQLSGLLQLVRQERGQVRAWLDEKLDGAIISSSLGMISNIHAALKPYVRDEEIGRVTGAQQKSDREVAKECPLILATPTVDIGYNFERSQPKARQNIDFLFCDASSGDELIQRIGRGGRVLAKAEKESVSYALVVLSPHDYKVLEPYAGQELERARFAALTQEMAKKNDLYAYVKTGTLLEIFRPIKFLKEGMSDQERQQFDVFFEDLRRFFAGTEDAVLPSVTFSKTYKMVKKLDEWQTFYGGLGLVPQEAFDTLPLLLEERIRWQPETFQDDHTQKCLEAFFKRLRSMHWPAGTSAVTMVQTLQDDLCAYYKERARFSFRESFQPPAALAYDPENLHSSRSIASYNALHFLRYYDAPFYETYAKWEQDTHQSVPASLREDALTYCHLHRLRDTPLRIGLKLDARDYTRDAWEEKFAYQVTAIYGLELVCLSEHSGLKKSVRELFRRQYVPAFLASSSSDSRTRAEIHKLSKQARFSSLPLEVTFMDGRCLPYDAILGTMAFQLCAELPYWAMTKDRRVTQREDDAPIIC
ncbi:type I-D CRISPR-associated helicase Cas3' [Ktedonobacter racemifer]|uniref:CRISPR-associated helicase, Cyano-type n=1 Tax=Ktedonobacter racemifer DSM 44963 TaxID=485913 RepID=D6TCJ9_KTERA|nr:type I-D CRISPR-associated helicase Cas3' [Ktedonobacter racemifer]EFH90016.1 CRISPR-associated helicase, Cyano-type [Ktedonobacter racemifer DSM 44963]